MPTYFLSLELPKRIVNNPIQGVGFETPGATSNFLETYLPFGETIFGKPILLFSGFEMERISFLFALSVTFLALVVANGLFKLYINTYKGRMGERILRRMRYELFDRVMRYPLSRFRRTKASEVASMIKDEVEPMGEYIGDAFTQPLFLGGQALVALLFIFLQNFWLGVATFVVVVFQAWLVPLLRKRLIELQRQRQIAARKFAGRLGEIVEGIQETHTNDTTNYHRAEISNILSNLFFIRFELFQRKFMVKFINNFLIQFLAFFFYAVGGYLAIKGTLDIGQLIGVIVAYKDLPAPVRGLIDQDQKRLTVEVRYGYEISRLSVTDETGSKLIEQASTDIKAQEKIAVVGDFNSGASSFAEVLAGVLKPTGGRILMDNKSIDEQPEYFLGRRIGYIDGSTYFPQGSILDALTYVLRNQPLTYPASNGVKSQTSALEKFETKRSGNFQYDFDDDWLDYKRLGFENENELIANLRQILTSIDMENDIRALGLRGTLDPVTHSDLANALLDARQKFRNRLDELGFSAFVEPFDPERYNDQSSIGENLLFGTAIDDEYRLENLARKQTRSGSSQR
ncbi:Lipid A export ATP-binding/permease protein MsbA [Nymphon striatum]|nr:Lipid A export ATP-binding/permease protein MsbA [Nymphon striatum]